jgi:hypothetical protein
VGWASKPNPYADFSFVLLPAAFELKPNKAFQMFRIFLVCVVLLTATLVDAALRCSRADDRTSSRNLQYWCHKAAEASSPGDQDILACSHVPDPDITPQWSDPELVEDVCGVISRNCGLRPDASTFRRYTEYSSTLGCSARNLECRHAEGPAGEAACGDLGILQNGIDRARQVVQSFNLDPSTALSLAAQAISEYNRVCSITGNIADAMARANTELLRGRENVREMCRVKYGGEDGGMEDKCNLDFDRAWQLNGWNAWWDGVRDHVLSQHPTIRQIFTPAPRTNPAGTGLGQGAPNPQSTVTGTSNDTSLASPGVNMGVPPRPVNLNNQPLRAPSPVPPTGLNPPPQGMPNNPTPLGNDQVPSQITAPSQQTNTASDVPRYHEIGPGGVKIDAASTGRKTDLSNLRGKVLQKLDGER